MFVGTNICCTLTELCRWHSSYGTMNGEWIIWKNLRCFDKVFMHSRLNGNSINHGSIGCNLCVLSWQPQGKVVSCCYGIKGSTPESIRCVCVDLFLFVYCIVVLVIMCDWLFFSGWNCLHSGIRSNALGRLSQLNYLNDMISRRWALIHVSSPTQRYTRLPGVPVCLSPRVTVVRQIWTRKQLEQWSCCR